MYFKGFPLKFPQFPFGNYVESNKEMNRFMETISVGEKLFALRKMKNLSQKKLAELTGITQPAISAIENNQATLGIDRAKILAKALACHPAVLLFPDLTIDKIG